ncbi:AfsR/SARP family transcriptional regulator [Cryptosporangium arvum]|uniref:DNA-binding transcriptional activator of the SARP family n=1 Tax=Cryptosporangium arvum DSM 44712 TaxID=927661 RepID=A0A011AK30_9ACTN|nr:BTAD domain-containing putative transcriptional regulator [Cryptosporangium arvum]EXG82326.1 DNA-binding transcriptional activator of the SARP family [Cryptosporangium arvum DSM 44712]
MVRFTLLGPVRAVTDAGDLTLGSPQQRGLLSLLLLRNTPVPIEDVVDALWGAEPPPSAHSTVRTYAARLRQVLPAAEAELRRSASGYSLVRHRAEVDADEFDLLVRRARVARRSGDMTETAAALRRALDLWAGPALGGVHAEFAAAQRTRLEESYRTAREQWFDAELALGRHEAICADLGAAVAERPMDARLTELWMTALHRSGRTVEALEAFRRLRTRLHQELGIEPGPELQRLHQRLLRGDEVVVPPTGPDEPRSVRPDQTPPDIQDFTGRRAEVDRLRHILTRDGAALAGITGLGGSGKSTLAVHVAHLFAEHFPDGRVHLDLGARTGRPMGVHEALGSLLRTVRPGVSVPDTVAERSALWRTIASGRRMLVVLDDADSSAQVEPLLPACAVIVTATRRLLRLSAVSWLRLGPLSDDESLNLLGEIAGHHRIAVEPDPASELVAACSGHPLSVRVAAARLLDRPMWTVERIVAQLDEDFREPVVMHEDCKIVDEPMRRAEGRLDAVVATVFRLGALLVTPVRGVDDVTAMTGLPRAEAHAALEDLVDADLLQAVGAETYRYSPLVQAFARRRAQQVEGPDRCRAALAGLVGAHRDHRSEASRALV